MEMTVTPTTRGQTGKPVFAELLKLDLHDGTKVTLQQRGYVFEIIYETENGDVPTVTTKGGQISIW